MHSGHYVIALSVLAAGAMIGTGLYFGLRGRAAEAPLSTPSVSATAPPVAGEAPVPPATTPSIHDAPNPPPATGPDSDILSALEKLRPALAKECWAPSAAREPSPASATFEYRLMFDANGALTMHSVNDPRETSRADVAQCLRDKPPAITIKPRGGPVAVVAKLTLP